MPRPRCDRPPLAAAGPVTIRLARSEQRLTSMNLEITSIYLQGIDNTEIIDSRL
jgi:hypothetical protein